MDENANKCFIITPIGNDTDPIRRHIEGIIAAAIEPAIGEKYEIVVAHKMGAPGSITKQIISEIYNDKLVIANLTDKNPNVMYELAFRHSLGKPVIMIAEKGTALPSDIIMERTIFYQNDAQGVLELRDKLIDAEKEILFDGKENSPIYDVLNEINKDTKIIQLAQESSNTSEDDKNILKYILGKLNNLEETINSKGYVKTNGISSEDIVHGVMIITYETAPEGITEQDVLCQLLSANNSRPYLSIINVKIDKQIHEISVFLDIVRTNPPVTGFILQFLRQIGFKNAKLHF